MNSVIPKVKFIPEFCTLTKFEHGDPLDISWTVDNDGKVIRNCEIDLPDLNIDFDRFVSRNPRISNLSSESRSTIGSVNLGPRVRFNENKLAAKGRNTWDAEYQRNTFDELRSDEDAIFSIGENRSRRTIYIMEFKAKNLSLN